MSGLYTYVGTAIDKATEAWVTSVSSSIISALSPIVLLVLTCWVIWYGYMVASGHVQQPVTGFLLKMVRIGLVLSVALGLGNYQSFVVQGSQDLINGMAHIFWPSAQDLYGALDGFDEKGSAVAMNLIDRGSQSMPLGGWSDLIAGLVTFGGAALVAVFALCVMMIAKIAAVFLLAVGPAFIVCFAFPSVSSYFDKWLAKLLNYCLLQALLVGACGLFMQIAQHFIDGMTSGVGTSVGSDATTNALADAFSLLAVDGVLAVVIWQLPSISAGLMGGIALAGASGIAQRAAGAVAGATGLGPAVRAAQVALSSSHGAAGGGSAKEGRASGSGPASVPLYRRSTMNNIAKSRNAKAED